MQLESESIRYYRITGIQSIERITPLLNQIDPNTQWINVDIHFHCSDKKNVENEASILSSNISTSPLLQSDFIIDFVWETTVEKSMKTIHNQSKILNRLHNTIILEDKSNFAFLSLKMNCPTLETYIGINSSVVKNWAFEKWGNKLNNISTDIHVFSALNPMGVVNDWWVIKASKGNGGKDIWVVNSTNYKNICKEIPVNDEFVIQKYVDRPLLYRNKKFHFRCYTVLHANMSALFYRFCYILTAGVDYNSSKQDLDVTCHISNLSVNKHINGYPGQIPCDLAMEYPDIYTQMQTIWYELVTAAEPYLLHQLSEKHFEFYGLDYIANESGQCYLIEINRLPGIESSNCNKEEEDAFYNKMIKEMLNRVLCSQINCRANDGSDGQFQGEEDIMVVDDWVEVRKANTVPKGQSTDQATSTWINTFKWKAYTKRNEIRSQIVLPIASKNKY